MKLLEKNKAIFYRKKGFSIKEISDKLLVSKSTISLWVRDLELGENAKKILLNKSTLGQIKSQEAHRLATQLKREDATKFGIEIVNKYKKNKSNDLILCALIYNCEGAKSEHDLVSFTNSSPLLLKTFLKFFRSAFILNENKFRVCLHLHKYHNEKEQLSFWSKTLRIPLSQFSKVFIKPNSGLYKKDGYRGCVRIRYCDVSLARKLMAVANVFMTQMGP